MSYAMRRLAKVMFLVRLFNFKVANSQVKFMLRQMKCSIVLDCS